MQRQTFILAVVRPSLLMVGLVGLLKRSDRIADEQLTGRSQAGSGG